MLTWTEAAKNCQNKYGPNSYLTTINDRFQQYYLNQEFLLDEPKWIGLKYDKTTYKYVWANPADKFTFDHWDKNRPSKLSKL